MLCCVGTMSCVFLMIPGLLDLLQAVYQDADVRKNLHRLHSLSGREGGGTCKALLDPMAA